MPHSHCDGHHDHDHESYDELGVQYNLFQKIDIENLQCLNESIDGAGKTVFKPWERRLDRTQVVIDFNVSTYLLFIIYYVGFIYFDKLLFRSMLKVMQMKSYSLIYLSLAILNLKV